MIIKIIKELIKYLLIGALVVIILFPLYYLLLQSLVSTSSLVSNKSFIFIKEWEWSNFRDAFKSNIFPAIYQTLLFATILISFRLLVYSLAIAGLLKMNQRYQKIFLYFFLIISLIPEFSIYLSLKTVLIKTGMRDLMFSYVTNSLFSFFNFTYMFNIAKTVYENKHKVMKNDNLKLYEKLFYVCLPKMKLGYLLLVVFSFISVWNDYLWPRFLLSDTYTNISIWYLELGSSVEGNFINLKAAGAVIALTIPLSIYAIFSRKIIRFN